MATGVEKGVVNNLPRFLDEALVGDNLVLQRVYLATCLESRDGGEGEDEADGEGGAEERVAEEGGGGGGNGKKMRS